MGGEGQCSFYVLVFVVSVRGLVLFKARPLYCWQGSGWKRVDFIDGHILIVDKNFLIVGYRQVSLNGHGTKSLFPAALLVHVTITWLNTVHNFHYHTKLINGNKCMLHSVMVGGSLTPIYAINEGQVDIHNFSFAKDIFLERRMTLNRNQIGRGE